MLYNLANQDEAEQAFAYLTKLSGKELVVKITKQDPNRTLSQNSYLHLLLSAFGAHFGYTLDEAKAIYKQLNHEAYYYSKKGRDFVRSSSDLTTEEMSKSIERFMLASAEQDYPLPAPDDTAWVRELENSIERAQHYL